TGNNSFGIAAANFCVANNLTVAQCAALDIEPNPDNDHVLFNTATGNGTSPAPSVPAIFAVDLAWDLTGTGNCWKHNVAATQFPPTVPACPWLLRDITFDVARFYRYGWGRYGTARLPFVPRS